MDDIGLMRLAEGRTPEHDAANALRALHAYGQGMAGVSIEDLGDHATEGVADLITDLMHMVRLSGGDPHETLSCAVTNYMGEDPTT